MEEGLYLATISPESDRYHNPNTIDCWNAWQAALSSQPEDLEACAIAMQKDFPIIRTGPDADGNWGARPLDIEIFKRAARAVLRAAGMKVE